VSDWPGDGDGWLVGVDAMEFVRSEPLESEFRQRILAALRAVSGVTHLEELTARSGFSSASLQVRH
jgi:hypothetical protein